MEHYYAEAILYIGLAGDLAERFKQHNGILPVKEGSKQKQIEEYFSKNERLGYTIFVQSPLSQPLVHRNRGMYEKFAKQQNSPVEDMLSEQGRDDIKRVEGILIESFRRKYGHFPPWNSIGGSSAGQTKVMENNINIVKSFHLCGWIFQLIALVSFDKGIIMPFDRMICSQQNTCTIRIIAL